MIKDLINESKQSYHSHQVIAVRPDSTIPEVARVMKDQNIGAVLVVENNKPKGIITDRDIVLRCLSDSKVDFQKIRASEVMTTSLHTVREDEGVYDCIHRMREGKVRRIPVVNAQGVAVGILTLGDILALLSKELTELSLATTPASEMMQEFFKGVVETEPQQKAA